MCSPAAATDSNVGLDANVIVGILVGGMVLIVTGIIIVVIAVRR